MHEMNNHNHEFSEETINLYLDGMLTEIELQEFEGHLDECPRCREYVSELENLFKSFENLPEIPFNRDLSTLIVAELKTDRLISKRFGWGTVIQLVTAMVLIGLLIPMVIQSFDFTFSLSINQLDLIIKNMLTKIPFREISPLNEIKTFWTSIFFEVENIRFPDLSPYLTSILIGFSVLLWLFGNRFLMPGKSQQSE